MAGTSAGAKKAAATRRTRKFLAAKHGGYLPGPRSKARKKAPVKKAAAPAKPETPAKPRKRSAKAAYQAQLDALVAKMHRDAAAQRLADEANARWQALVDEAKAKDRAQSAKKRRNAGDIIKKVLG